MKQLHYRVPDRPAAGGFAPLQAGPEGCVVGKGYAALVGGTGWLRFVSANWRGQMKVLAIDMPELPDASLFLSSTAATTRIHITRDRQHSRFTMPTAS